jgi:hypothetical protein
MRVNIEWTAADHSARFVFIAISGSEVGVSDTIHAIGRRAVDAWRIRYRPEAVDEDPPPVRALLRVSSVASRLAPEKNPIL